MELREDNLVGKIVLRGLGDAGVDHLGHGAAVDGRDENVRGLDVAVDDALLVRVLDRVTDGNEKLEPLAGRELVFVAVFRDGLPLDQFHDEVRAARLGAAAIEHAGDVGMIHHGQRLPLGFEASNDLLGVHAQLDDLQRHAAADRLLLLGHIDRAEAAVPDHLEQRVTADHSAGAFGDRRRHGGSGIGQTWQLAHIHRIPVEEVLRPRRSAEQAFDAFSHSRIAIAGKIEVGG